MNGDKDSVDLPESLFKAREALEDAIQGRSAGDPSESEKVAIKGLERCVD